MADVSVIIPCYNGSAFIAQTIKSVLEQTQIPQQLIVIDDGSTDDSARIIQQFVDQHPRVVELVRQANAGESTARNVGIARSRGSFIAFLDADDYWMPTKIQRQLDALQQMPDAIAVHTRVFNFHHTLDDMNRAETERTKDDPTVRDLIDYHYVAPSTLLVRRDALGDLRFNEKVSRSEDMLFMGDLRLRGRLRLVDEPLVGKRVHAQQQSGNPWHTVYSIENRVAWCRERAGAIGQEQAADIERMLVSRLIKSLEDRYWRRDLKDLGAMRDYVARLYPKPWSQSFLATARLWPHWLYRLRDTLGG